MLQLTIIGHLGNDATVNNVNGKNVINFSVAHSVQYKDAHGTKMTKTTWVKCAKWGETTALAPYLKKGTMVMAQGEPQVSTYTNNDRKEVAELKITVTMVQLLSKAEEKQPQATSEATAPAFPSIANNTPTAPAMPQAPTEEIVDDLPF